MKVRHGFVSNSSSSSFIIEKQHLTDSQIDKIKRHSELANEYHEQYGEYAWNIQETEFLIKGDTSMAMANFDMYSFLIKIGVNDKNITMLS